MIFWIIKLIINYILKPLWKSYWFLLQIIALSLNLYFNYNDLTLYYMFCFFSTNFYIIYFIWLIPINSLKEAFFNAFEYYTYLFMFFTFCMCFESTVYWLKFFWAKLYILLTYLPSNVDAKVIFAYLLICWVFINLL